MAKLNGKAVLIVDDEALIAMDLGEAFQEAGASVTTTTSLDQAKVLIEHDGLDGVVLDHALGSQNADELCERLTARGIAYLIHSGRLNIEGVCKSAPLIRKPAAPENVVDALGKLIEERGRQMFSHV